MSAPATNTTQRPQTISPELVRDLAQRDYDLRAKSELCCRSYYEFVKEFWGVIVNDPFTSNWHVPFLCQELQALVERVQERKPLKHDLIVNIPPGTTKTLLCTVLLIPWAWSKPGFAHLRFIKASYASDLSLEHANYIRDIVQSDKYQRMYPWVKLKRDTSGKSNFKVIFEKHPGVWQLGGGVLSTSIGAKGTGFHAHIKVVDDPLDPFKAHSEAEIKSTNAWLGQVLSSRVVDKKIVPEILVMQRVSRKDPTGVRLEMREKGKKIRHICLPGEILTTGNRERVSPQALVPLYDACGGFLDPIRLDQEVIDNMEMNLGTYGKKAQIDQNPMAPGSGMFEPDNITIRNPKTFNEPAEVVSIVRYWDNAATQDGGAYTCGLKLAQLKNGRYLIMDLVRGRWGSDRREQIKEDTTLEDGPHVKFLQEQEGGSGGKDQAVATGKNIEKYGNHIIFDRPTGDKVYRADPVSVAVNRGMIQMLEAPWNKDIKEELRDFPTSDYKDITDTLAGAYNYFMNTKRAKAW